jgi:magnesium-transporting ATPase (P-type)
MAIIYLLMVLNIASIFICHYVAKTRGAKPIFWAILGALFGPLAIPFVFIAKPKPTA